MIWFKVNNGYWNSDPNQDPSSASGGISISGIQGDLYPGVSPYGYGGIRGKISIYTNTNVFPTGFTVLNP